MKRNLRILQNPHIMKYDIISFERNPYFLDFLFWIDPDYRLEKLVDATITSSKDFKDNDECELKTNEKKVSFLIHGEESWKDFYGILRKDLSYFKLKYLPQLNLTPLYSEDYKILKISLLESFP